ncbi:NAD(P)H-binding protein [Kineococcus sp. TRM81007]|uniref:SDR family oxidoreductase n=1 Tax=Kineococcus sp. TRM81007 TaxID=2925831 RepID=UPI0027E2DE91|nr:NAD(P)H-binding protein [Kineococcus sp. TRM81007]
MGRGAEADVRVAVAGGTGVVGRLVVAELVGAGVEAVPLARSRGVDLVSGRGLEEALRGADAVVDVSSTASASARGSVRFFGAATANLLSAADRAGTGHVVVLSVVGADRVDLGHYLGKRCQEELLAAGPVPWTLLRATQFHEFAQQLLGRVPGPLAPVPVAPYRPVAAREVAAHLAGLARRPAAGVVPPIAGPEVLRLPDAARRVLAAGGRRRLVVPVRVPGRAGRALAAGALLPEGPHVTGTVTLAEHLEEPC